MFLKFPYYIRRRNLIEISVVIKGDVFQSLRTVRYLPTYLLDVFYYFKRDRKKCLRSRKFNSEE